MGEVSCCKAPPPPGETDRGVRNQKVVGGPEKPTAARMISRSNGYRDLEKKKKKKKLVVLITEDSDTYRKSFKRMRW